MDVYADKPANNACVLVQAIIQVIPTHRYTQAKPLTHAHSYIYKCTEYACAQVCASIYADTYMRVIIPAWRQGRKLIRTDTSINAVSLYYMSACMYTHKCEEMHAEIRKQSGSSTLYRHTLFILYKATYLIHTQLVLKALHTKTKDKIAQWLEYCGTMKKTQLLRCYEIVG